MEAKGEWMMFMNKNTKYIFITVIFTCFGLLLQINISASKPPNFIRPGHGVGIFKLGLKNSDIKSIIKQDFDDIRRVKKDDDYETWLSYKNLGLTLIYTTDETLTKIIVTNKALYVEGTRISVGSDIMDLRRYKDKYEDLDKKFKKIKKERKNKSEPERNKPEYLDFKSLGINFWINWNNYKIVAIEVKKKE